MVGKVGLEINRARDPSRLEPLVCFLLVVIVTSSNNQTSCQQTLRVQAVACIVLEGLRKSR